MNLGTHFKDWDIKKENLFSKKLFYFIQTLDYKLDSKKQNILLILLLT